MFSYRQHPVSTYCATSGWAISRGAAGAKDMSATKRAGNQRSHAGPRGGAFVVAQTRLGVCIHHAMRTVGLVRRIFDMICERAVSRYTQGEVLANKQLVQEMVATPGWKSRLPAADSSNCLEMTNSMITKRCGRHLGGKGDDAEGPARRMARRFSYTDRWHTHEMPFVQYLVESFVLALPTAQPKSTR